MTITIHPYAIASGDRHDFTVVTGPEAHDICINLGYSTKAIRPDTIAARKIIEGNKTSWLIYKCELLYPKYHLSEGHVLDSDGRLVDHVGRPLRMNYGFLVDTTEDAEKILQDDGILQTFLEKSKQAIEPHVYDFIPKFTRHQVVPLEPIPVEVTPSGKKADYVIVHDDYHIGGEDKVTPAPTEAEEELSELDEYLKQQKEGKKKMPAEDAATSSSRRSGDLSEQLAKESKAAKSFPIGKIVGTTVLGVVLADGVRRIASPTKKTEEEKTIRKNRLIGAIEATVGLTGIVLVWKAEGIQHFFSNASRHR